MHNICDGGKYVTILKYFEKWILKDYFFCQLWYVKMNCNLPMNVWISHPLVLNWYFYVSGNFADKPNENKIKIIINKATCELI